MPRTSAACGDASGRRSSGARRAGRASGVDGGEPGQGLVEVEQVEPVGRRVGGDGRAGSTPVPAARPPPCSSRELPAGVLDQDAAHRLGRGGEEVAAAVPELGRIAPDQPEKGLVDQGRRLKCLPGLLLRELPCSQLAELVVDQGQELLGAFGSPCSMAERRRVTSLMVRRRRGCPQTAEVSRFVARVVSRTSPPERVVPLQLSRCAREETTRLGWHRSSGDVEHLRAGPGGPYLLERSHVRASFVTRDAGVRASPDTEDD